MMVLLNENADRRPAPSLRESGHDVTIVGEDYPASIKDDQVLALATQAYNIRVIALNPSTTNIVVI